MDNKVLDFSVISERCGVDKDTPQNVINNIANLEEFYDANELVEIYNYFLTNVKNPEIAVLEFNYGGFCPTEFTWNGLDKNGKIAQDGEYDLILTGSDMAGNTVVQKTAEHFVLDTSKTEVMLASSDLIFSLLILLSFSNLELINCSSNSSFCAFIISFG